MFKRGGFWWSWKREGKHLVRRSTGCKDQRAASAVVREWERAAADPSYRGAYAATLADGIEWLKSDRRRRGRAEGTLEMYDQKTRHLARIFGETSPLGDIDAARVDAYVGQREREGAKASTVHKELVALRGILKLARRRGAFHREPSAVMPIGYSPQYKPRTTYLPLEQWPTLLAKLADKRARHVAFMLATGANLSEAERAKPEHVTADSVYIDGRKTAYRERTIPILPITRAFVEAAAEALPFEPWTNIWRDLNQACKAAGLPPLSSNDLRRSFCSALVQAGVPFEICAKLMGHGSTSMVTKVYGQLRPHHLASLARAYFDECDTDVPSTSAATAATGTNGRDETPRIRGACGDRTHDRRIKRPRGPAGNVADPLPGVTDPHARAAVLAALSGDQFAIERTMWRLAEAADWGNA